MDSQYVNPAVEFALERRGWAKSKGVLREYLYMQREWQMMKEYLE